MSPTTPGVPARPVTFERERGVYKIIEQQDLAHVVVKVDSDDSRPDDVLRILRIVAAERIPIFMMKLHRSAVTFALDANQVAAAEVCLRKNEYDCKVTHNLVLITILATSMRDLTGVMADIADALNNAGARLYGVGDSHNSVQCLIDGSRTAEAVAELTRTFQLEVDNE